jgi:hypothetical protein
MTKVTSENLIALTALPAQSQCLGIMEKKYIIIIKMNNLDIYLRFNILYLFPLYSSAALLLKIFFCAINF